MVGANYIAKLKLYEKRPFNAKGKHAELHGDPEVSEGGGVIPTMRVIAFEAGGHCSEEFTAKAPTVS